MTLIKLFSFFWLLHSVRSTQCLGGCVCDNEQCLYCEQGLSKQDLGCEKCKPIFLACISRAECDKWENTYISQNGSCYACAQGCELCEFIENHLVCKTCLPGYLKKIDVCEPCSPNCKSCSSANKCDQCDESFYMNQASASCSPCPNNCQSCTSPMRCDKCQPGYYGSFCQRECPAGCNGRICNQNNGACAKGCRGNLTGTYCNLCKLGTYGTLCENNCPLNCEYCWSDRLCSKCQSGFHGIICEKACSPGCFVDSCVKDTGDCHLGLCKKGLRGHFCKECLAVSNVTLCGKDCARNCLSCSLDKTCIYCMPGYFGTNCQENCSSGCLYRQCAKEHGNCLSGCHDGMYGGQCQNICPGNCKKCVSDTFCLECNDGFLGTSSSDRSCSECLPGLYGLFCNMSCPNNCLNDTCNRQGECYECKPGYFGRSCSKVCPQNCKETVCSNEGICRNCLDGYIGEKCDSILTTTMVINFETEGNNCSVNCVNETCHLEICTYGCKDGFYGQICNLLCNSTCLSSICHRHTGECMFGCLSGESNHSCSNIRTKNSSDSKYSVITISLVSVSGFVVIGTTSVFVLYRVIKRKHIRRENSMTRDNDDGYATVMEVVSSRQSVASIDTNMQQSELSQEVGNRSTSTNEQPEAERSMALYNLPFEQLSENRGNEDYSEIQNPYYITCI